MTVRKTFIGAGDWYVRKPEGRLPRFFKEKPMPKSFNNLWERIIDFENLFHAYKAACKGKRYRWESLKFKKNLEENLIILQNELIWGAYQPEPYRQFTVYEPKMRLISVPTFRDRVVHHALCQVIEPIFENRFVNECFTCRVGRGTHAAMRHVERCARTASRHWGGYYVLKCDISSFFPSIDHDILKAIISKNIADPKVMQLADVIIRSYESADQDGKGIPIGALTSQLFANVILNPMDHWLKENKQIQYYARYMDDFVILHHDKQYLRELLGKIENYLYDKLKLNLNPKTGIFPGKHGIDFCGYRIWPIHIKPRKSTVKRTKQRLKKLARDYKTDPGMLEHAKVSIQSFLGYIMHCNGWRTTKAVLEKAVFKPDLNTVRKSALSDIRSKGLKNNGKSL
jgi:retron-type reverse transcriptase